MWRRQGRKRAEKHWSAFWMTVHLENCTLFHGLAVIFFSFLPAGLFFWSAVITPNPFMSYVVYFCECSLFYTLAFLQTRVMGRWRFSLSRWGHLLEVSTMTQNMTPHQPVKSLWAIRHSSFGPFRAIQGSFFFSRSERTAFCSFCEPWLQM